MDKANIYYPSVYALEEWMRAISWNCWSLCGESTPAVSLRMEMQYLNTRIRKQYVYKWGKWEGDGVPKCLLLWSFEVVRFIGP